MRRLVWSAVAFVVTMVAVARIDGQRQTGIKGDENLYARGLLASLREITRQWGEMDDSVMGTQMRTDWHKVIMEKDPELTDGMPSVLDDYRVEYLDCQELIDRYKKLRKEFSIIIVHPMKNEGKRLKVWFSVAWIKYEKRTLRYGFSAWSKVYFRYDCAAQEYVVDEVKLGGI
jgi:hypothetical protein